MKKNFWRKILFFAALLFAIAIPAAAVLAVGANPIGLIISNKNIGNSWENIIYANADNANPSGSLMLLQNQFSDVFRVGRTGDLEVSGKVSAESGFCIDGTCKADWASIGDGLWTVNGVTGNIYYNSGNVGIGTTSPVLNLEVKGQAGVFDPYNPSSKLYFDYSGGSIPTIEVNNIVPLQVRVGGQFMMLFDGYTSNVLIGSGTYAPEKLTVMGNASVDDLAVGGHSASYDIVNGSPWRGIGLSDYVTPDGTTGIIQVAGYNGLHMLSENGEIFLAKNGNVGIGTTSPVAKLDIEGHNNSFEPAALRVIVKDLGTAAYFASDGGTSVAPVLRVASRRPYPGLYTVAYFEGNGYLSASAWTYGSDRRLKENIKYFSDQNVNALDLIGKLRPASFDYINGQRNTEGFIAQDVQTVLPSLISTNIEGMLGMQTTNLIPYLVKAIQEQQKQIEDLKNKLEQLEK